MLPFPFSIRGFMIGWNPLFFTPGRFLPDPKCFDEFNRGAYLVEGVGHCGACHTPFNASLQPRRANI
ncbi:mono/diheme cytochrome c family protein [Bradyrhizobium sp. USDA 4341]